MRTLLLDNSYFPIKVVNWQRAMILLLSGRAEIVTEYSNQSIRSVSKTYQLPKILKLFSRHKAEKKVKFTRYNLYYRDNFQCQYCTIKLPINKLTFDHVIPQSKGGKTSWENVVACCAQCNVRKGSKNLKECGMRLLKKPGRPKWSPQLCLRLKETDPAEWHQWFPHQKEDILLKVS